ncbi:MAG: class I SAM-dependent methyltransferase [Thiobacillaceae bacterium]
MLSGLIDFLVKKFPSSAFLTYLAAARELRWRISNGSQVIYLEYPVTPRPRYGFGKPPHPTLNQYFESSRTTYANWLGRFAQFNDQLSSIPFNKPSDPRLPYWNNGFIAGFEAVALYCYPVIYQTKLYVEIGSGNSTKFVRQSVIKNGLHTKIVSIDPSPRAEIDDICDEVRRERLEDTDQEIFDALDDGDILMFDGSHRCFQNSDVTVFFLEILPRLKRGVLVYIDDIYLPYDYPPVWQDRFYSEQYLLATLLLAAPQKYDIELPCIFISKDEALQKQADVIAKHINLQGIGGYGSGIWLRVA